SLALSSTCLTHLDLSNCYNITDDIIQYLPLNILYLNFCLCKGIRDDGLRYLPPTLTYLNLSSTRITDHGIKHLPTTLKILHIKHISDYGIEYLSSLSLKYLVLNLCLGLTEDGI